VALKTAVVVAVAVVAQDFEFPQLLSHDSALPPQLQPDQKSDYKWQQLPLFSSFLHASEK